MKFAVLVTGDPTTYTQRNYGDYARLFLNLLEEPGETWEVFDVRMGEFPSHPGTYTGMVVTGSSSDAHDDLEWIVRLMAFIRQVESLRVPQLGVCFGHQVLARALGGMAQRNPAGWEIGIHDMLFSSGFGRRYPEFESLKTAPILEVHQDHVAILPRGAELLAGSPNTPVQVFSLGDHVLGVQGHPEFNRDIVRDLIDSRASCGIIESSRALEGRRSLESALDESFWRSVLLRFLKP